MRHGLVSHRAEFPPICTSRPQLDSARARYELSIGSRNRYSVRGNLLGPTGWGSWFEVAVKDVGVEVGAIWPSDGAKFVVNKDLTE